MMTPAAAVAALAMVMMVIGDGQVVMGQVTDNR